MNAVLQIETAAEASYRFAKPMLDKGFEPDRLHVYTDEGGEPLYYRIRLRHPNGEKWIRPFYQNGGRWQAGEPKFPANSKPLYGLERLTADATTTVYVVEGEAVCEELWKLGLSAVTSGSSSSDGSADWSPLRGRPIIIWPDNDEPGYGYQDRVATKLLSLGCSIDVVDVQTLGLGKGEDAVDWLSVHSNANAGDIAALVKKPAGASENSKNSRNSSAPEQLRRSVSNPEPYPVACLGEILSAACLSLQRVIQAPDAICGASVLAAASLVAQGLADVENDGRVHPLSLWMLSVAESGERKSGVDKEVMRAIREHERALAAGYALEREHYESDLEEWNARRTKLKGDSLKKSGVGLSESLRELGSAPPEPLRPVLTVADFTAEGVAKLLTSGLPSIGAFTDEAALVFGGHGMNKETVARTAATLCKLWDCGELDRIRAGDGPVKLWGRRFAMHLLAQPVIAERALSDAVLSGQGFLPRCLLAWPQGTAGTRTYRSESLKDDPALIRYSGRLQHLLNQPLPLVAGQRNELQPRTLRLTPTAFEAWRNIHNIIEKAIGPDGKYSIVKPWASKSAEQCLRIAGVLRMIEQPDANTIDDKTIDRAAELALWHLNEASRLAGTAAVSEEIRHAEALLGWCHNTGRQVVYSTDALQFGPGIIRDNDVFRAAMAGLERANCASKINGGMVLDGRHRKNVWQIVDHAEET